MTNNSSNIFFHSLRKTLVFVFREVLLLLLFWIDLLEELTSVIKSKFPKTKTRGVIEEYVLSSSDESQQDCIDKLSSITKTDPVKYFWLSN